MVKQERYDRTPFYITQGRALEVPVHGDPYRFGAQAVAEAAFGGGKLVKASAEQGIHKLGVLAEEHKTAVRLAAVAAGVVVLFAAGQAVEQTLNIRSTVFAAGPTETPMPNPADCQRIVGDLINKAVRTSTDEWMLQAAIKCTADHIRAAAAMATPTPTPLATPIASTLEKGIYFNPEGLAKAFIAMSPAFLGVLGIYWLVEKNRENYANSQQLQLEDALSFRSGRRVPVIKRGARGAILCASAALALIWSKIIPESWTVPALASAATIGFITAATFERRLPEENRYRDWAEHQDEQE